MCGRPDIFFLVNIKRTFTAKKLVEMIKMDWTFDFVIYLCLEG